MGLMGVGQRVLIMRLIEVVIKRVAEIYEILPA